MSGAEQPDHMKPVAGPYHFRALYSHSGEMLAYEISAEGCQGLAQVRLLASGPTTHRGLATVRLLANSWSLLEALEKVRAMTAAAGMMAPATVAQRAINDARGIPNEYVRPLAEGAPSVVVDSEFAEVTEPLEVVRISTVRGRFVLIDQAGAEVIGPRLSEVAQLLGLAEPAPQIPEAWPVMAELHTIDRDRLVIKGSGGAVHWGPRVVDVAAALRAEHPEWFAKVPTPLELLERELVEALIERRRQQIATGFAGAASFQRLPELADEVIALRDAPKEDRTRLPPGWEVTLASKHLVEALCSDRGVRVARPTLSEAIDAAWLSEDAANGR